MEMGSHTWVWGSAHKFNFQAAAGVTHSTVIFIHFY